VSENSAKSWGIEEERREIVGKMENL